MQAFKPASIPCSKHRLVDISITKRQGFTGTWNTFKGKQAGRRAAELAASKQASERAGACTIKQARSCAALGFGKGQVGADQPT